jgi:predicted MFS family arabinose efflux permease
MKHGAGDSLFAIGVGLGAVAATGGLVMVKAGAWDYVPVVITVALLALVSLIISQRLGASRRS